MNPLRSWSQPPAWGMRLLSKIYRHIQCCYEWHRTPLVPFKLPVPVISVGGLTVGGAGKTPCVLAITAWLRAQGYTCIAFTRGYKGTSSHVGFVQPEDTPQNVGEEAWMLSQHGPVFRSKDILTGARTLAAYLQAPKNQERTVIVWDDGHQYPKVHKDLSLVVTNVEQAWGNGHLCPAGPLREDFIPGLQRSDMIVCLYFQAQCTRYHHIQTCGVPMVPVLCQQTCDLIAQTPVVGFCGLGDPTRFYNSLAQHGLEVRAFRAFSDHHTYTSKDEDALERLAVEHQAVLITSHKDYVKLSCDMKGKTYQMRQHLTLPQTLTNAIQKILV